MRGLFDLSGKKGEMGEEVCPSSVFLNSFGLKCAVCQGATLWGTLG